MSAVDRTLTPELLDLMEHEKAIEQNLVDIGWHLQRIRDDRKYHAAGYGTFEDYCRDRLGMGRSYVNRQIRAAVAIAEIEALVPNGTKPQTEAQVRPLTVLDTPEQKSEAWAGAVGAAEGDQPTAAEVQAAVDELRTPKPKPEPRPVVAPEHPAQFSDDILNVIAVYVAGLDRILDPFAGVGGVHRLRGLAGVRETIGIELEPEWAAKHPDTISGDALDMVGLVGLNSVDAVVTSPAYGNRMADHHDAQDDSVRLTYTHVLGRKLTAGNTGAMQWGDDYRDLHRAVWSECAHVLKPGGLLILNVKDHVRGDRQQQVAAFHTDYLCRVLQLELIAEESIVTRGVMAGANANVRVPFERVFVFRTNPT